MRLALARRYGLDDRLTRGSTVLGNIGGSRLDHGTDWLRG
jgi:hypothetical protein